MFLLILSMVFMGFGLFSLCFDLVYFIEWEILSINSSLVSMSILFDWMSLIFSSFVLFISCMVILYSLDYMSGDYNINRFVILVLLFVLSMILLIISPNLISILLGWDGLGLISYCLVIYYQNFKSYSAGMLTVLMNRVGDVGLLLAISWMMNYGSWNFIFYIDFMHDDFYMKMIGGLVLIAGLTKSAQIPFSSWLPAAMAAPTPVSALVHSSTLVTAGVYLLIRFNVLISGWIFYFLLFISVLTMFMAGVCANYEYDLKKIIALSTLSQLGLMMMILSMGFFELAYFHMLTHAIFKALLFMCAGMVIHSLSDFQDIRYMGGLINFMPLTCICFNISNLSLCGMPFLAGFYSKDLVMEIVETNWLNVFIFIMFFFSIGLTVCYSFRLSYYLCFGEYKFMSLNFLKESGSFMMFSMVIMTFMVVFIGSIMSWLLFPTPLFILLPLNLKCLGLMVSILGGWLGYEVSSFLIWLRDLNQLNYLFNFFGLMWFMPLVFSSFNYMFYVSGLLTYKSLDQGWSELLGGKGLKRSLIKGSKIGQFLQMNNLKIYFILLFLWMFGLILFI
uniref:NADH-ubiquinone oxidoreductase chain 5 n=1 Tax=Rhysodes sp. BMNH-844233 TaxID=1909167 RepID=A0A343A4C5_9CARA|nr:NADH dehydrogenase subunit 5 [Rhysodes sp. BMNH-844233]